MMADADEFVQRDPGREVRRYLQGRYDIPYPPPDSRTPSPAGPDPGLNRIRTGPETDDWGPYNASNRQF